MTAGHTKDSRAGWSLKRLAWAFGCAKKGSEEEKRLGAALGERVWKNLVSPCCEVRVLVYGDGVEICPGCRTVLYDSKATTGEMENDG